jgi:hypothetical protein
MDRRNIVSIFLIRLSCFSVLAQRYYFVVICRLDCLFNYCSWFELESKGGGDNVGMYIQ